MLDIAQHVRIFAGSPTDEFVTKRKAAIKEIAANFIKPNNIGRLLSVANGVALASKEGGKLPPELAAEISTSIVKVAPSFVAEGSELELSTCALLAAFTAIESGSKAGTLTTSDYLAVGIWSGLSWQTGSKNLNFERLRKQLLELSRAHVLGAAQTARVRAKPTRPIILAEDNSNLGKVIEGLRSAIDTLNANAVVDREEIDLLWWSISGWSDALGMKYVDAKPHAAAIALGLDAACRLRRMPVDLHKALVLRRVPEGDSIPFSQLAKVLDADCSRLGARFGTYPIVADNAQIFPLLNVLTSGSTKGIGKSVFSTTDLATRALLEAVTFDVIDRREV